MDEAHLYLRDSASGGASEPVHAVSLGGSTYRVSYSPGIVYGVAADDEIEVDAEGKFRVLRRGGNLAVRVLCESGVDSLVEEACASVERLGGRLDGRVESGLVFTIPIQAGFEAVERLFNDITRMQAGAIWEYGNVYDDAGRSLLWWAQ
jgi:hypothetical protein